MRSEIELALDRRVQASTCFQIRQQSLVLNRRLSPAALPYLVIQGRRHSQAIIIAYPTERCFQILCTS